MSTNNEAFFVVRIGFAEGVWMVGVIDEIRLPQALDSRNPILIDTKTRSRDTLPSEPQRRNGRYVYYSSINVIPLRFEFADQ